MREKAGGSIPSNSFGPEATGCGVESNDLEGGEFEPRPVRDEPKLYAVARKDLAMGLRTAQVGHALIEWTCQHGRPPDNLVVLAVADRGALYTLWRQLRDTCRTVPFFEPDLDGDLTALAVGPEGRRPLSSLPLLR